MPGKPKGLPKTGGRRPGSRNKANVQREAEIKASGLTPLEYLIQMMRNKGNTPEIRIDAAKAAAPYVHPKLATISVNGSLDTNVVIVHDWRGKSPEG